MKSKIPLLLTLLLLKASIVTAAVNDKNIVVNVGGVTISARTPTGFYKTSDTYPAYFEFVDGKESKLTNYSKSGEVIK